jgi:adenylate cyclase
MATTREHAEYKQVTVLFADVVRSMHLASAVEAERLREIMTGIFNRSTVVVHRYAGTVDKFTGDGIMALFGAPAALEDHAMPPARMGARPRCWSTGSARAATLGRRGSSCRLRVERDSRQTWPARRCPPRGTPSCRRCSSPRRCQRCR